MSAVANIRRRRGLPGSAAGNGAVPAPEVTAALESGVLSRLMARDDSTAQAVRTGSARIHGSALAGEWCSRRHAIFFRHGDSLSVTESPRAADLLLWAIGRAVEHHIRSRIIALVGKENCLGLWRCLCGKLTHAGFGKNAVCGQCKSPLFYGEFTLSPPDVIVDGNPDLIVNYSGLLRTMEIKSKKMELFAALEAPEGTHIEQCSVYTALLKKVAPPGYTVDDRVHIIYGAKDYPRPGMLPYKDYVVPVSLRSRTIADQVTQELAGVMSEDRSAPLPPRLPSCSSATSPRAKKCGACGLCFNLA